MSTELLMNFNKTTSKNTGESGQRTFSNNLNEKKVGTSLFDSLMNEAKSDKKSTENFNSEIKQNKNSSAISNLQNNIQTKSENVVKQNELPDKSAKLNENRKTLSSDMKTLDIDNNTDSIKKMVNKLVEIVVSEAKKIYNSDSEIENTHDQKDLKSKVEKILESKINNIVNKDELKNVIDKKLDIVKSSVNKIEKEAKTISNNNNIGDETSNKLNDSKSIIKNEINVIKDNVTQIKNDVSLIDKFSQEANTVSKNNLLNIKGEVKVINDQSILSQIEKETPLNKDNLLNVKDEVKVINDQSIPSQIEKETPLNKDNLLNVKGEVKVINDQSIPSQIEKETPLNKDNLPNVKDEVKVIKGESSHNQIEERKSVNNDNLKNETIEDGFSDNKLLNKGLITKIEDNLSIIDKSTSEINTDILKTDINPRLISKIEDNVTTIKEAVNDIKEKVFETIIVKTTENEIKKFDSPMSTSNILTEDKASSETPLLATMFLNSQNSMKNKTSLEQIYDAKTNIIEKKSIESVKESANKLDLNIEEVDVDQIEESGKKPISKEKSEELKTNTLLNRVLNRVVIDQKIDSNFVVKENIANLTTEEVIVKPATVEDDNLKTVELIVPKDIVSTLQNKIIGAQQKVSSFMSDVAKNMYLNYNPPVTAFRVNLNPANLGTISIIMKANKVENSLSVSMNLSNSNTMESFTENKAILHNAIQKQFSETSDVTIDFNLQDQNSDNEFNGFNSHQDQNQGQGKNEENNSKLEETEEKEIIENNDYM